MRQKLKDCQGFRTQAYQHSEGFIEGDLVWFQHRNGNAWLGPAAVLCQRGQSVWLHTNGDIKKVAACRVKPFQLVDRKLLETESEESAEKRRVMLEDGLQDVNEIQNEDTVEDENEDTLEEKEKDTIGAKYLKVVNSVSFSDLSVYTVELPVSEHGRPEVKTAKMNEVKNLLEYDVFEEVEDLGQETIGSRWVITSKEIT